jgi:single-strand selective monofunctional uracil DNA glycosylase
MTIYIRKHMNIKKITDELANAADRLSFGPPVTRVYNPLKYARAPYDIYLERFASPPKQAVFLGMNPGPWGMAQTGVPFGEIKAVKNWMKIEAPVGTPPDMHEKRPVEGFACKRSEVSGERLWGWAKDRFQTPERFFDRFFVANYCPLVFMEKSGKNRTPNALRVSERKPLLEICDLALRRTIDWFRPRFVIGVGKFAEECAKRVLSDSGSDIVVAAIAHPSPANPSANRGWAELAAKQLADIGIDLA